MSKSEYAETSMLWIAFLNWGTGRSFGRWCFVYCTERHYRVTDSMGHSRRSVFYCGDVGSMLGRELATGGGDVGWI